MAGCLRRSWGDIVMAVHGQLYDAATLPSLVAALLSPRCGPTAVTVARRRKPSIPSHGHHGLSLRDELDLELTL